jgi:hypothetical protein
MPPTKSEMLNAAVKQAAEAVFNGPTGGDDLVERTADFLSRLPATMMDFQAETDVQAATNFQATLELRRHVSAPILASHYMKGRRKEPGKGTDPYFEGALKAVRDARRMLARRLAVPETAPAAPKKGSFTEGAEAVPVNNHDLTDRPEYWRGLYSDEKGACEWLRSKENPEGSWEVQRELQDAVQQKGLEWIMAHLTPCPKEWGEGLTAADFMADTGRCLANYKTVPSKDGKGEGARVGLRPPEVAKRLLALTDGWPKRVGPLLFAAKGFDPVWLEKVSQLFAWAGGRLGETVRWAGGEDKVTQEVFDSYLRTGRSA